MVVVTDLSWPVFPFGPFFPDFGPDPDFFEEIGPEMVQIYTKKVPIWLKMKERMVKILWTNI